MTSSLFREADFLFCPPASQFLAISPDTGLLALSPTAQEGQLRGLRTSGQIIRSPHPRVWRQKTRVGCQCQGRVQGCLTRRPGCSPLGAPALKVHGPEGGCPTCPLQPWETQSTKECTWGEGHRRGFNHIFSVGRNHGGVFYDHQSAARGAIALEGLQSSSGGYETRDLRRVSVTLFSRWTLEE